MLVLASPSLVNVFIFVFCSILIVAVLTGHPTFFLYVLMYDVPTTFPDSTIPACNTECHLEKTAYSNIKPVISNSVPVLF